MKTALRLALPLLAAACLASHAVAEGDQEAETPFTKLEFSAPSRVNYACHFGRFRVLRHETAAGRFAVLGVGALINSGGAQHPIHGNKNLAYEFSPESGVTEGSVLSAFCITGTRQADGSFKAAFSVPGIPEPR